MESSISEMRYVFTDEAKADLIQIRRFTLKNWGQNQSVHYLQELQQTLSRLTIMPQMGICREQDLGNGIYSFPYASHTIYYTLLNERLIVMAVLHQSMVPDSHLENRKVKN